MTSLGLRFQFFGLAAPRGAFGRIAQAIAAITSAIARENRSRRASADVRELSDYLLADIGVSRPDIDAVVRGDYSPRP